MIFHRIGAFCLGGVASESVIEWIPSQEYGANRPQYCTEGTYCKMASDIASGSGLCFPGKIRFCFLFRFFWGTELRFLLLRNRILW